MSSRCKRLATALTLFCCALLLTGCAKTVEFSGGKITETATDIRIVLQPGETALLDALPALKTADLRGSVCYDEIMAWAEKHPEVAVRYSVALPGDIAVDSSEESVDLPAPGGDAEALAGQLRFLPSLKTVSFGGGGAVLSSDELALLCAARPDIQFECSFSLFGQTCSPSDLSLDLTGAARADAEELLSVLPALHGLKTVQLGDEESSPKLDFESIAMLQKARPDVAFNFAFTLYGREFTTRDTEIDIDHVPVDDDGAAVAAAMVCMSELSYLDMDSCGVDNEHMAAIRDSFPNVDVVWRVWFGGTYSVRTDVEKILASRPSVGGEMTPEHTDALKYCTKLKYLDVGHNPAMTDISFLSSMPELEVAVLSISGWSDASPIADCPKLEYLEIQSTYVTNLTPLSGLKELRHLNIANLPELTDISPLYSLTKLERLWVGCIDPVPEAQIEAMQAAVPGCVINTTTYDPTAGGWRWTGTDDKTGAPIRDPRYDLLIEQFGYEEGAFAYSWLDPEY